MHGARRAFPSGSPPERPPAALVLARASQTLGPDPTVLAVRRGRGLAAVATALLPRIGWLMAAAALCGWLVSPEADRQGTALVLAAAAAPIPLLLPRAGLLWSVPVLAPLLGRDRARAGVRRDRRARSDARAPRRPRRRRLLVARSRRGAHRQGSCCSASPDGTAPARGLGGLDQRAPRRDALGPLLSAPGARARARLGGLRGAAAAGRARPLAGASTCSAPGCGPRRWSRPTPRSATCSPPTIALDQARGGVAGAIGAGLVVVAASQLAPRRRAAPARPPRVTTA